MVSSHTPRKTKMPSLFSLLVRSSISSCCYLISVRSWVSCDQSSLLLSFVFFASLCICMYVCMYRYKCVSLSLNQCWIRSFCSLSICQYLSVCSFCISVRVRAFSLPSSASIVVLFRPLHLQSSSPRSYTHSLNPCVLLSSQNSSIVSTIPSPSQAQTRPQLYSDNNPSPLAEQVYTSSHSHNRSLRRRRSGISCGGCSAGGCSRGGA